MPNLTDHPVLAGRAESEAELLERARRSDRSAIRLIIRRHNQKLYRIARSIVKDDGEAEDVLQEAYARALANLDGFRGESSVGTWLGRIVMNEALGRLRQRRRATVSLDVVTETRGAAADVIPFPNARPQLDPETITAQHQIRALLERAIDDLPEGFRVVLVARLVEGLSTEDTAELVGILPETVKTRLHRARGLLRQALDKQIGPALGDAFPFAGRRCERVTERVLARLDRG